MIKRIRLLAAAIGLTAHRCPICGTVVQHPAENESGQLCANCARTMPLRTGGYCPGCGHMSGREHDPPSLCPECRRQPPPWSRLHFHGKYTGTLRTLILSHKFSGAFGHARLLADMAARAFTAAEGITPDCIVPVPLHRKRLAWRGFNQSSEMARILAAALNRPIENSALQRTRNTPPQTRFRRTERLTNIKGAFRAAPQTVRGKAVLLVDDVYTTGATLRECAVTLKQAEAASVTVLVLARAEQKGL